MAPIVLGWLGLAMLGTENCWDVEMLDWSYLGTSAYLSCYEAHEGKIDPLPLPPNHKSNQSLFTQAP